MLGIIKGLTVTVKHIFKPKITQIYPYVKPRLPERSRGLIQLITERETGVLRCEACLLCEKVCPPRAITIEYSQRDGFRRRPLLRPKSFGGFYRPRSAVTAPYPGRIVPTAVDVPESASNGAPEVAAAEAVDQALVATIIARVQRESLDPLDIFKAIQDALGYVPQSAAKQVSEATDVDISTLYSMLTLSPVFRLKPGGASRK